jgi:hypothetical protein
MAKMKGGQGMDIFYIVVGIIIFIIIAYFVYTSWFSGINNLSSGQVNLNVTKEPSPILASSLTNPNSTRYSYGIWVYVNSWDTTNFKTIFSRYKDVVLYLDKSASVLKCVLAPTVSPKPTTDEVIDLNKTTYSGLDNSAITIVNNFSLQKWVYITIVVDNVVVDIYINGKMVKSLAMPQVQPDSTSNIYYGYKFDAVVNGFQRWSTPLDDQSVYNYYMNGSSSVSGGNMTGGYHATVSITKNNSPTSAYKLF